MATRDIYESGFDEEISSSSTAACPECGGRVRTNTVETVCEDCGLIVDEHRIDHGPEWRSFEDDQGTGRERTGAPLTVARHDWGLSTEIGLGTDANGNRLSIRKRRQLDRLRREQNRGRWQSKAERNLSHGLGEVRRIASSLGLSKTIRDQACQIFRSAQNDDILIGRSIEAIAAASVFGACRCNGRSSTVGDVAGSAQVGQSRVANAYKTLDAKLGLPTQPVTPKCFIPKIASTLDLAEDVQRRALHLADRALETPIVNGRQPTGVAAACVYVASQEHGQYLTQVEISEGAETTPVTLRNRRNELRELIGK